MRKNTKKLNNRAMTLVEVLVAIVIIGIVGSGVLSICVSSMRSSLKNSRLEYATSYAKNINEIWLWHKRYNPQKAQSDESDFQTFHYSLARFIFTLEYDPASAEPEIFIVALEDSSDNKTCFVVYFDSDWKQLKVPIDKNATPQPGDVVESDVAYSILIQPGNATLSSSSLNTETITIEVFTSFVDPSETANYLAIKNDPERLIVKF